MIRPETRDQAPRQRVAAEQFSEEKTRHRVQQLRIEKRCSILRLSEAIRCDVETVAAYERGDAILETSVVRTMERVLNAM